MRAVKDLEGRVSRALRLLAHLAEDCRRNPGPIGSVQYKAILAAWTEVYTQGHEAHGDMDGALESAAVEGKHGRG